MTSVRSPGGCGARQEAVGPASRGPGAGRPCLPAAARPRPSPASGPRAASHSPGLAKDLRGLRFHFREARLSYCSLSTAARVSLVSFHGISIPVLLSHPRRFVRLVAAVLLQKWREPRRRAPQDLIPIGLPCDP